MKTSLQNKRISSLAAHEKNASKILMEKMGLSQNEFKEIKNMYGVDASKLLELMQLSKYQFVFNDKVEGECEPCAVPLFNGNFLKVACHS